MRLGQTAAVPIALLLLAAVIGNAQANAASDQTASTPIKHVVIIMQENHSFDNYFGSYPEVNGLGRIPPKQTIMVHHMHFATRDPCHSADCSIAYFNGGKMDGWSEYEAYGYYNAAELSYYWQLAQNYTLLDNYFSGFMGPSLPNRIVAIAGWNFQDTNNAPTYNGLPLDLTIFDRLNDAKVDWTYYAGYCCNLNGFNPLPLSPHHLTARDTTHFYDDLSKNKLSTVTWIMPAFEGLSEHARFNVTHGMLEVKHMITAIKASRFWQSTAILLTWDEPGGYYDHVAPPNATFGFRVPMLVISPFARHGFVDHKFSSHSSTLALIETLFHLNCMKRDCHSSNLIEAFSFNGRTKGGRPLAPSGGLLVRMASWPSASVLLVWGLSGASTARTQARASPGAAGVPAVRDDQPGNGGDSAAERD